MYRIINKKKLIATIAADVIGNILFFPKQLFKKREKIQPENIKEILVIRTAYIGDVVMTLPILKPLKERFPDARISFLTAKRAADVLINNPYVNEIITYDPFWFYPSGKKEYFGFIKDFRKRRFDLVIETRGDIRDILFLVWPLKARFKVGYDVGGGGYCLTHKVPYRGLRHKVIYHLDMAKYLGCDIGDDIEWGIYLDEDEKKRAGYILVQHGIDFSKPLVALHPGSRKELKCWSAEGYAAVADFVINELKGTVLLTGAPDEAELVKRVAGIMKRKPVILAGKTSLRELAGVISRCSLFICNDSSPMHIAAAMKTPTVAIFGPSKSAETAPYGKGHIVLEKDFACRYTCDEDVCHFRNHKQCMRDISEQDVLKVVRELFLSKVKNKGRDEHADIR